MDEQVPFSNDAADRVFQRVMVNFDAPAYIRRARRVEAAFDAQLGECGRQRKEMLMMVNIRLGILHGLAGSWEPLVPLLSGPDQIEAMDTLLTALHPQLEIRIEPTSSWRKLRAGLRALVSAVEQFNAAWSAYLPRVDVSGVNQQRDGYNRYYVLEKECAVRSLTIARQGFEPLAPLTTADLFMHLPLLPVPQMAI